VITDIQTRMWLMSTLLALSGFIFDNVIGTSTVLLAGAFVVAYYIRK